jgi:hypothetical protein
MLTERARVQPEPTNRTNQQTTPRTRTINNDHRNTNGEMAPHHEKKVVGKYIL